jgi:sigma-B regulation protein RsbU (phosphoserine phosphatase)
MTSAPRKPQNKAAVKSTTPTAPDSTPATGEERHHVYEGDYRPVGDSAVVKESRLDFSQVSFLVRLADTLNTTLDLNTLLRRVADLVRAVIDYRIFAILLYNDRTHDLRMRFQTGHTPEIERMRIRIGRGIVGQAALIHQPVMVNDVSKAENYINANPNVRSELAIPLLVKGRVIGVIDIQSERLGQFTEEHLRLLQIAASRVAAAIENARLYTRVARQAQTLTVLNEISRELTSILDLDELLARIGQLLKRVIDYQMFAVLLVNEREQVLESRFSQRYGETAARTGKVPLSRGLVGAAVNERRPVLVGDVRKDDRYILLNPETRSELTVPLIYKGTVIGVMDLEHTRVGFFNEDHVTAMGTLSAQIAIAIENARLYQRLQLEEQRLERDLAMAREVQLRLLPQTLPQPKNAQFAAKFLPARTIGGDIYDFLDYGEGRCALVLGDVSGKAAPAALYAALVSGILRSFAARKLPPADMLAQLNNALQERRLDSQYVTMLFALWDDATRSLVIANAGSVQPLFARGKSVETVSVEGFPLGLFPNATYDELTLTLAPGDVVAFFSDGITDAENGDGDMFGSERLAEVVAKQVRNATAQSIMNNILKYVETFQGGVEHFDDETIVVMQALPDSKLQVR